MPVHGRPGAGEFTRRAFINGKMDLTQAESVMDLIAANGRLAARTALAAREGGTYRRLSGRAGAAAGRRGSAWRLCGLSG